MGYSRDCVTDATPNLCSPFIFQNAESWLTPYSGIAQAGVRASQGPVLSTIHEIQARSQGANLTIRVIAQSDTDAKK